MAFPSDADLVESVDLGSSWLADDGTLVEETLAYDGDTATSFVRIGKNPEDGLKLTWDAGLANLTVGDVIRIYATGRHNWSTGLALLAYTDANSVTATAKLVSVPTTPITQFNDFFITQAFIDQIGDQGSGKFSVRFVPNDNGTGDLTCTELDQRDNPIRIQSKSEQKEISDVSSSTITAPSGIADDDLLIIVGSIDANTEGQMTFPSGFTEIAVVHNNSAGDPATIVAAYKIASSESGDYDVSWTTAGQAIFEMYRIDGHVVSDPIQDPGTFTISTSDSLTTTGFTTDTDDQLIFACYAIDDDTIDVDDGSRGQPWVVEDVDFSQSGGEVSVGVLLRFMPFAGATGQSRLDITSSQGYAAIQFGVRSISLSTNVTSERGGRIDGESDVTNVTDERGGRISGEASATDERGGRIHGEANIGDERGGRISGTDSANDERGGRLHGKDSINDERGGRVQGVQNTTDERGGRIEGTDSANAERGGRIHGEANIGDERGGRVQGFINITSERGGRIDGEAGIINVTSERGGRVQGVINVGDERGGRVEGTDSAAAERGGRIHGEANIGDERGGRVHGIVNVADERGGRVAGKDSAADERGGRVHGIANTTSERGGRVEGTDSASAEIGGRIEGKAGAIAKNLNFTLRRGLTLDFSVKRGLSVDLITKR